MNMKSLLEQRFAILLREMGVMSRFKPEFKFHPTRKWKVDFCDIGNKIAVEIEGGAWSQGRHTRGAGFVKDAGKYNQLTVSGYRLLRYTGMANMQNFRKEYPALLKQIQKERMAK